MTEDANHKRDREFLERVLEERDRANDVRFKALEKLVEEERGRIYEVRFKALEDKVEERDGLYKTMFAASKTAVETALTSVKESTASSFASSEKAIVKAEDAQRTYNQGHNDLSRKMEAQYKEMVPITEARIKWESIDKEMAETRRELATLRESQPRETSALRAELMKEIGGLRESRSEGGGATTARHDFIDQRNWLVGIIVAIVLGLLGFAAGHFTIAPTVIKP